jgi:hypothetical protein
MMMKFSICSSILQRIKKVPNIDQKGLIQKCHPIERKNDGVTFNLDRPFGEPTKKCYLF